MTFKMLIKPLLEKSHMFEFLEKEEVKHLFWNAMRVNRPNTRIINKGRNKKL
jgi:hypothetical protein